LCLTIKFMQSNEKTRGKFNLQANDQPKKIWQDPVLTKLDLNNGNSPTIKEDTSYKYTSIPQ